MKLLRRAVHKVGAKMSHWGDALMLWAEDHQEPEPMSAAELYEYLYGNINKREECG